MSKPPSLPPARPVSVSPPLPRMFPWVLVVLLIANILPELILQMTDRGVMGPVWLRALVYRLATFQRDLLDTGGPVFPGQSLLMFFTYGFVHTGLLHLTLNMVGLVWLGRMILAYRTTGTFILFYLMSTVGAAELFALIGPEQGAIAGASGALFGLFGVYVVDQGLLAPQGKSEQLWPQILRLLVATVLIALSDVLGQSVTGSAVAWQAHAGGFLTGALIALMAPPRFGDP